MDSPTEIRLAAVQAETAAAYGDRPALCFPDRAFTHEQVRRLGAAFATRMAANGIGPASVVNVATQEASVAVAALLGAARLGACVIQIGEGARPPEELSVTHTLLAEGETAMIRGRSVIVEANWSPAENAETGISAADPDAPWLYVHTSGTTGLPKFVALSQRMVVDRSRAVSDDFPTDGRAVLLYPVGSRPWLARTFAILVNGGTLCSGLAPEEWAAQRIDLVSGSRAQFRAVLDAGLAVRLARAEVIGARLPRTEARQLLAVFETVDDTFGSSETSKCLSTLWRMDPGGEVVATGKLRDSAVELVDAAGQPVSAGNDGILRIRNGYMVKNGYVGDPVATAEAFRGGWFYPGDVASLDVAGVFQFRNRMDHIVNIEGEKINAYAVDMVFLATRGIRDAIVFRNPKPDAIDELFAFVVFDQQANRIQAIESAKYAIRERFGDHLVPRVIRPVAGIPRKQDGTPDRKACADIILAISAAQQSTIQGA